MNTPVREPGRLATAVVIALVCAAAAVLALDFPSRARVYPLTVAVAALLLAGWEMLRSARATPAPDSAVVAPTDVWGLVRYAGWGLGYYAVIWLLGIVTASALFVAAFLIRVAGVSWRFAISSAIAVAAVLLALGGWLDLRWPRALADITVFLGWS